MPATRSSPAPTVQTDDELDGFVREQVESAYHPCGTARLGRRDDPLAVVDPECRVIGVEGLRVADSSIFPRITNGNLNAPSMMVGEKAADHILGRPLLPRFEGRALDQPALADVGPLRSAIPRRVAASQPPAPLSRPAAPSVGGGQAEARMAQGRDRRDEPRARRGGRDRRRGGRGATSTPAGRGSTPFVDRELLARRLGRGCTGTRSAGTC